MARTVIPITTVVPAGSNEAAGTAVDPTNGHYVDVGSKSGLLLIVVNNTAVATKVVTSVVAMSPVVPPALL